MKIGEVRHLDGVKGNFGISDTEYIATATPIGSEAIISHAIYSNVKEDLLQHHYTFVPLPLGFVKRHCNTSTAAIIIESNQFSQLKNRFGMI